MPPTSLLDALKKLHLGRNKVRYLGPTSDEGREWLTRTAALLRQVDESRASEFETRASVLGRRLSSDTLDAAWHDMMLILETTIAELELKTSGLDEKVYAPRAAYDLYTDLRDAIGGANTSVFVVDPYADEEVFDLYFARCAPGVHIRFLTKRITPTLQSIMAKFRQKSGINLEVRTSDEIHDRVIFRDDACWVVGTSIGRHAATKKPTYLIAIHNIGPMRAAYEEIWARATHA